VHILIRVRVKRRIEINKIDTRIRKLAPVAQPLQIVAEIQPVHSLFYRQLDLDAICMFFPV
jgi:hypothetical protein